MRSRSHCRLYKRSYGDFSDLCAFNYFYVTEIHRRPIENASMTASLANLCNVDVVYECCPQKVFLKIIYEGFLISFQYGRLVAHRSIDRVQSNRMEVFGHGWG